MNTMKRIKYMGQFTYNTFHIKVVMSDIWNISQIVKRCD